jgi:pimeloyl-ACP methyl ester carboxylesterase
VSRLEEKVFVVGHDWGAAIAYKMVDKNPDLFEKVVGLDVGPLVTSKEIFSKAALYMPMNALHFVLRSSIPLFDVVLEDYFIEWVNCIMCKYSTPSVAREIFERSNCDRRRSCYIYYVAIFNDEPPADIKVPTLVLHSGNPLTDVSYVHELLEYNEITSSKKHWDYFYDDDVRNRTILAIKSFLGRVDMVE